MLGRPILPANLVIIYVSNLGFFFPYQYPIPIVKKTGKRTSKSLIKRSI